MKTYEERRNQLGIDAQIKAFFAKGGKITECKPNTFGLSDDNWTHRSRSKQWKRENKEK